MELPKRKPARLKDYDYSQNGAYYITICTEYGECVLSSIVGEGFPLPKLTKQGATVEYYINMIEKKYPCAVVDKYVIMPNHIHLIIVLQNDGRGNPSPTISSIMGWFKYQTTKELNSFSDVKASLWQRSYFDRVIRNEQEYQNVWKYIDENPLKWEIDRYHIK